VKIGVVSQPCRTCRRRRVPFYAQLIRHLSRRHEIHLVSMLIETTPTI